MQSLAHRILKQRMVLLPLVEEGDLPLWISFRSLIQPFIVCISHPLSSITELKRGKVRLVGIFRIHSARIIVRGAAFFCRTCDVDEKPHAER